MRGVTPEIKQKSNSINVSLKLLFPYKIVYLVGSHGDRVHFGVRSARGVDLRL